MKPRTEWEEETFTCSEPRFVSLGLEEVQQERQFATGPTGCSWASELGKENG